MAVWQNRCMRTLTYLFAPLAIFAGVGNMFFGFYGTFTHEISAGSGDIALGLIFFIMGSFALAIAIATKDV